MNDSTRRSMDIALATEARGMYAELLTDEEKQRMAQLRSAAEFMALLARSAAWHAAALPAREGEASDEVFSEAVSRCIYADYDRFHRFANEDSRRFLEFVTLDLELQAILRALRRAALPGAGKRGGAPAVPHSLAGHNFDALSRAETWDDIVAAAAGGIFEKPLLELRPDGKSALPSLAGAAAGLEAGFYDALAGYMREGYAGPARDELFEAVTFRADMLNISFVMRLRRFKIPPEQAEKLLLPLHGALTSKLVSRALEAPDDESAFALLRSAGGGKHLPEYGARPAEAMVREAQREYFRKVLHGPPTLAAVYAYLVLRECEGDMLRRVFVALRYGLSPAGFMD